MEQRPPSIRTAYVNICELEFLRDPANLKDYVEKRKFKNPLFTIGNLDIGSHRNPSMRSMLLNCPGTSIDIKGSFGRLNKLLRKDRFFSNENIENFFICMVNK